MGTGIVAVALVGLPLDVLGVAVPGRHLVAAVVWGAAAGVLVLVGGVTVREWVRHPERARAQWADPTLGHFSGAPAMALMTVGAGLLLLGGPVAVSATLWGAGTALGLATAVVLPYRAFVGEGAAPDAAFGGWLMPVVPPMVSAATGAALIPHLPAGQARLTMLLACYAMFGLTLLASLFVVAMLWTRLTHHALPPAAAVPTLWIVLGPLGQSVTAANALGGHAPSILPSPYGEAFTAFGVVYGVPVLGFALLWLALAVAVTARTARRGLPFTLTWWSFTFPLGTVVTGTSALAEHTGAVALAVLALLGFAGLVTAWAVTATLTLRAAR